MADWLSTLPRAKRIWIGHSFGCRVGLQLAARHPDAIDGLFLVAAAGLQRTRTPLQQLKIKMRVAAYKSLRFLPRLGIDTTSLRSKFGSADYRNAGPMRPILVKVVQEDLTDVARRVRCPVQLVYGELDDETPARDRTPPGKAHSRTRASASCRDFDHYTILTSGAHQVQHQLERFVSGIQP